MKLLRPVLEKLFHDGKGRDVLIGSGIAFLIKLSSAFLSYIMFLLIARALGVTEYGAFSFGFALAVTLGNIAGLGSGNSILRFLPGYYAQQSTSLLKGFVFKVGSAVFTSSLAVSAVLVFAALAVPNIRAAMSSNLLIAVALLIPLIAYGDTLSSFIRVNDKMVLSLLPRDVMWRILIIVVAGIGAATIWSLDASSMMWAITGLYAVVLLLQTIGARKLLKAALSAENAEYDIPSWISVTLPLWGATTLAAMIQQFDVVMLGLLLAPDEAGPYFAAQRTATLLTLFQLAASLAGAPLIARYHATQAFDQMTKMARFLSLLMGGAAVAGFIAMLVLGEWLLSLFNPSFAAVYPVMIILCLAYTVDALAGPTAYLLQMTGGQSAYLKLAATSYAITIVLQLVLIPHFGLVGAAIPNALCFAATSIIAASMVRRRLGFDPSTTGALRFYFSASKAK